MTLKMTERECVCVSVGEGGQEGAEKGRGRECKCTRVLSHTQSPAPSTGDQPLREARTWGYRGCARPQRKTDRKQVIAESRQMEGGEGEKQVRSINTAGEPPRVAVCLSGVPTCSCLLPLQELWPEECPHGTEYHGAWSLSWRFCKE
jgi:hypothetical protein